jgi:non-homologous end joining protein Ku
MANAASRSAANTTLYVGTLKASVGLFTTKADPAKTAKFDTAGPNGGTLKFEQRSVAVPVGEEPGAESPVASDPLAAEHERERVALAAAQAADDEAFEREFGGLPGRSFPAPAPAESAATLVDGEFRRVLVEEGSGQIVEADAVRRGVRREDGSFVDCTEQITAIEERTKLDRIDIIRCIDGTRIRRERVLGSYYVGAQDAEAKAALRLLYDALRERREVAIVKYTTRSRQQLGVIMPHATTGTLVLLNVVWAEDWRAAPAKATSIQKVAVPERQVLAMCKLLGALHGHVDDLDVQRDDAVALREELKARALAGEMDAEVVEPLPAAVPEPDLEGALEASLAAVRAGKV